MPRAPCFDASLQPRSLSCAASLSATSPPPSLVQCDDSPTRCSFIRKAMVSSMFRTMSEQDPTFPVYAEGFCDGEEKMGPGEGAMVHTAGGGDGFVTESKVESASATCVLWSTVGVGCLIGGRPKSSVSQPRSWCNGIFHRRYGRRGDGTAPARSTLIATPIFIPRGSSGQLIAIRRVFVHYAQLSTRQVCVLPLGQRRHTRDCPRSQYFHARVDTFLRLLALAPHATQVDRYMRLAREALAVCFDDGSVATARCVMFAQRPVDHLTSRFPHVWLPTTSNHAGCTCPS